MNKNFKNHLFNPYLLHETVPKVVQLATAHNIYKLGPRHIYGGNPTEEGRELYKHYLSVKDELRNKQNPNKKEGHVQVGPWFHHGDYMDNGETNEEIKLLNVLSLNGIPKRFKHPNQQGDGEVYVVHK